MAPLFANVFQNEVIQSQTLSINAPRATPKVILRLLKKITSFVENNTAPHSQITLVNFSKPRLTFYRERNLMSDLKRQHRQLGAVQGYKQVADSSLPNSTTNEASESTICQVDLSQSINTCVKLAMSVLL